MTTGNSRVKTKKALPATSVALQATGQCIHYGAPEHSLRTRGMVSTRIPKWFCNKHNHPSTSLSAIDVDKVFKDMACTELNRLQKVQEWLRHTHKDQQPMPSRTDGQVRDSGDELPSVYRPAMSRQVAVPVIDAKPNLVFPGIIPNEMHYVDFRSNCNKYFGLNQDYTTPNKSYNARLVRQRNGEQMYYGTLRQQMAGQKLERQTRKIHNLQSNHQDMIRR